jgi:hypothetical protein
MFFQCQKQRKDVEFFLILKYMVVGLFILELHIVVVHFH